MAKKKFDTNPLNPEFPEKVKREAKANALPKNEFKTAEFPPASVTEHETRRFDEANFNAYQTPFTGQNVPAFQTAKLRSDINQSSKRKVAKIGLPENILMALSYIPFWIGLVASLITLLASPKSETKVRFHAAQGLAAHLAIFLVGAILEGVDNFIPLANAASGIFWVVTTVMLIIFAVKAYQGKPIHIESVDNLTEWLEDKIKPKE